MNLITLILCKESCGLDFSIDSVWMNYFVQGTHPVGAASRAAHQLREGIEGFRQSWFNLSFGDQIIFPNQVIRQCTPRLGAPTLMPAILVQSSQYSTCQQSIYRQDLIRQGIYSLAGIAFSKNCNHYPEILGIHLLLIAILITFLFHNMPSGKHFNRVAVPNSY